MDIINGNAMNLYG